MKSRLAAACIVIIAGACAQQAQVQQDVAEPPQLADTSWRVEQVDGQEVPEPGQSTLEIIGPDRVAGRGGCNRFAGSVVISGNSVSFGRVISTQMACPALNQETRFLAALQASRSARIDAQGKLILMDETGAERVRLSRTQAPSRELPAAAIDIVHVFDCPDGSRIETRTVPGANEIDAVFEGRTVRLTRVPSASGAAFSDGTLTLRNKGRELLVESAGSKQTCTESGER